MKYKAQLFLSFFLTTPLIISSLIFVCTSCNDVDHHERATASKQWMTPNGNIKAFSTTAMIEDLVQQIGGSFVDSAVLIKGQLDPHTYQLVKGDDEKLAFADIIFYNGLGLEHGPGLQDYLKNHTKAIALGDHLMQSYPELILKYKGQLDPHIWMDVSLWAKTVDYIAEALSAKDKAHAANYAANGEKLKREMWDAHQRIFAQLQTIPEKKRYLVTSHDAFNYFALAYLRQGLEPDTRWKERFVAPEGLAPESQISTTNIRTIIEHIRKYQVSVIFPESNVSKDSIRKIVLAAKEEGLELKVADVFLYADAMGQSPSDGDTYLKMMQHNANAITSHLKAAE